MTPAQYNRPLPNPKPRKLYSQLSDNQKEVVSLISELYIQRANARGEQIAQHQRFDLYNHFANLYTEEQLDKKHKELYKNRDNFTDKQRNLINDNRYYDPFERN